MSSYNFALLILLVSPLLWFIRNRLHKRHRKLPPGPRGLPIIGSLHLLGKLPNRTLHNLAKKHGPIMSMYLGNVLTIVVSSPQAAEKFLKTHDLVFASRPIIQASEYVSYGSKGVVSSVYGPYWRHARKFCTLELLSVKKIDSFAERRREELVLMVRSVKEAAKGREVVDVSGMVGGVLENMTYKMLFGRSNDERFDLKGIIRELLDQAGAFNVADFIPILGPFDLQGLSRLIRGRHRSVDNILEIIISEHEAAFSSRKKDDLGVDFVDTLLSLLHNTTDTVHGELSRVIDRASIKAIIIDMIAAAIDTSHTAIEWAMTELIRHPRIMQKLHAEIEGVVGDQDIVEEVDLSKLNYLDLVIKENFRLHPVIPFLIPRESMEDIEVNGYYIPKGSRVLISSWTLGRDSDVWLENVEEFLPERFSGKNTEIKGRDFRLLPFGSGRRVCPGINLGLINVKQIVAQLVRSFDWELPNGMSVDDLDMDEKFGLSLPRKNHLKAVPNLRL